MPKVTAEYKLARRHEIATAAMRLFARKGFQATSVADIIAESGLSAGAIYGNYRNKDELIQGAIEDLMDRWMSDLEIARTRRPLLAPGELVATLVKGAETGAGDLAVLIQVWAEVASNPGEGIPTDRVGERLLSIVHDYLIEWYSGELKFSDVDAARSARAFAPIYLALVQGYVVQTSIFASFDREAYLAAASAIRPDLARLAATP
jgi:AcrR family transcriptional regulator